MLFRSSNFDPVDGQGRSIDYYDDDPRIDDYDNRDPYVNEYDHNSTQKGNEWSQVHTEWWRHRGAQLAALLPGGTVDSYAVDRDER
jgi:hypothetical protein